MAAKKAEIKKIKYNETHRFMYSRVHIQSRRKTTMLMSNDIGIDLGTASILVYTTFDSFERGFYFFMDFIFFL